MRGLLTAVRAQVLDLLCLPAFLLICLIAPLGAEVPAATPALDVYDGRAVLSDPSGMVHLLDVTQPSHPVPQASIQLSGEVRGVALAGDRILAAAQGGIYILQTGAEKTLSIEHFLACANPVQAVVAAGNLGYAASGSSVLLFDIPSGTILDEKNYSDAPVDALALAGDSIFLLSHEAAGQWTLRKVAVQNQLADAGESLDVPLDSELVRMAADGQWIYLSAAEAVGSAPAPPLALVSDDGRQLHLADNVAEATGNAQPARQRLLVFSNPNATGVVDISGADHSAKMLSKTRALSATQVFALYFGHVYTPDAASSLAVSDLLIPNGTKTQPVLTLASNLGAGPAIENQPLRLTANIEAGDVIRSVEFYVEDTKVATDGNFPFEYRTVIPEASAQSTLTFHACAVDLDNNRSCSPNQTVEVTKDKTPLRVLSVSPQNNSHTPTRSIAQIEARFSHPLDLSTISASQVRLMRVDARSGSNAEVVKIAHVTFQPVSNKVTIVAAKPLSTGTYRATLVSAIKSAAGARLGSDYSWKFSTGATDTWINPASGNWSVATNWSGGVVPQSGDDVVIALPGVTVTYSSGTLEIDNLTVGSGSQLSVTAGTLGVDGQGVMSGTLSLAAGTYQGTGSTTINGPWNWTGGTVSTVMNLASTSTTLINSNNPNALTRLTGGTINNQGTVNLTPGYGLYVGGVINNEAGATWNLTVDGNINEQTGGVFNNSGTLQKTGGTGTSTWSAPVTGAGPININSGTLSLTGATTGTISGVIHIATGAALGYGQAGSTLMGGGVTGAGLFSFNNAATVSGNYSFAGTTQIQSGNGQVSFTGSVQIANLNFTNGTLAGAGSANIGSQWNWYGGTLSVALNLPATATALINSNNPNALTRLTGGTINNQGTVNLSPGYGLYVGGIINNQAGATWNLTVDGSINEQTGGAFNNSGTLQKTGGTGTSTWSAPVTGAGPININSGTLSLTGATTGTISGVINIATGAALGYGQAGSTLMGGGVTGAGLFSFNNAATVSGSYSFAGTTQIQSGNGQVSFTGSVQIANLNFTNGTLAGAGSANIGSQWNWYGGTLSVVLNLPATATALIDSNNPNALTRLTGGTINNQGTVNLTPGYGLYVGGVINNQAGATWNLTVDGNINEQTGGAFNNSGTLQKTGGTGTSTWSAPVTGAGPININSGTLSLTGATTGTISGVINIATGAALGYGQAGSTLMGGGVTGAGLFSFNNAATVSGTYSFTGTTQIQSGNGQVSFTGSVQIANLNFTNGTLAGAGSANIGSQWNWYGGTLSVVLNLSATATALINSNNPNALTRLTGGTINNQGTVNLTPGYGLYVGGIINNQAGATWNLTVDGNINEQTGGAFHNTGTLAKTGGTGTTNWGVPITGTGSINNASGTWDLTGPTTGAIGGSINVSAGTTINYGQTGSTLTRGNVSGSGTFIFTATATVSGTYSFSGQTQIQSGNGQVSFTGKVQIANLNFNNGTLGGAGSLTISGQWNWMGGTLSAILSLPATATALINSNNPNALTRLTGGTINNQGTVNLTPGYGLYVGGNINNQAGATWNLQADGNINEQTGGAFHDAGTLTKTGGTGTTNWGVPITGTGSINNTSGTWNLTGPTTGTISGPINVDTGTTINYGQTGSILTKGNVAGSGTFTFTAAANVNAPYSFSGQTQIQTGNGQVSFTGKVQIANLNFTNGVVGGTGSVTITGQWNWTGGTLSAVLTLGPAGNGLINSNDPNALTKVSGGTINNQGAVNLSPGYGLYVGGTINNLSGATWSLTVDGSAIEQTGGAFNNAGTLQKTGGTGTSNWSVPVTGSGSININSGTLTLSASTTGTISGTINVGSGAALNYGQSGSTLSKGGVTGSGTFTFTASVTVNGFYSFSGQTQIQSNTGQVTFTGNIKLSNLNLTNGILGGSGSLTITGTMNWTGGTVASTGAFTANNVTLSSSGSITIALGSSTISVTDNITLAGSLSLSFTASYLPPVGSQIPVFSFSGGFGGSFGSIFNLVLSNGDPLSVNLSSSGLSLTVQPKPQNTDRVSAQLR